MIKVLTASVTACLTALWLAAFAPPAFAQEAPPAREVPEITMGAADAPVQLIEYASFTCPHCATFHSEVLPRLKADYIDSGRVFYTYREVYFDRYGLWAALVARCAGPERYVGMADLLYGTQREWSTLRDPAEGAAALRRLGRVGGLEEAQLEACLSDIDLARAMVAKSEADMRAHDIRGTPSMVIDGKTYSNMPYEELRALIEAALAQ